MRYSPITSPLASVKAAGMHIRASSGRWLDHLSSPSGRSNLVTRSVMCPQRSIAMRSITTRPNNVNHRFIVHYSNT